jgi:hypothetical protein
VKLFLIEQSENSDYETYDAAVVIAENEEEARNMNPATGEKMTKQEWADSFWCFSSQNVRVTYLGESVDNKKGLVCTSFSTG